MVSMQMYAFFEAERHIEICLVQSGEFCFCGGASVAQGGRRGKEGSARTS